MVLSELPSWVIAKAALLDVRFRKSASTAGHWLLTDEHGHAIFRVFDRTGGHYHDADPVKLLERYTNGKAQEANDTARAAEARRTQK